ncbi:heterokaryon incompatibility protein [Rutstroemia sp. NJR-2017a BVV2]|nr:heterokaryon incompatibility protein [Rutstroemia sp. NJR-2017a BVV2]
MASVYGNSTCNIAALGKDSHAGCFHDRNPLSYSPCRILSSEQGDVYFSTYRSGTFNDNSIRLIKDAPLFKRAWVFQERMLAPRNIYFGGSQIHWDCIQGSACEIAPKIKSTKETVSLYDFAIGEKKNIGILQGCVDDLKKSEAQAAWQHLIAVYNQLLLTVATDKLIALSAIANLFEKRFGLTYLDGLWKEHLPGGLLWYINYPALKHSLTELPSWSWAAMNSDMKSFELLFSSNSVDGRKKTMDARVLAYHGVRNTTIGRDFLGHLPRYSLTLRGWIKPVKYLMRGQLMDEPLITEKGMSQLNNQPFDLISVEGKKRLNMHSVHLDTPISQIDDASCTPCETDPDFYYLRSYRSETLPEGYTYAEKQFREVCLMLIYSGSAYDEEEGLILEEYGTNPNHYIRVGYFSHERSKVEKLGNEYQSLFGAEETDIEERTFELF